ncbi:transposase [Streptomyces sp. QTS137]
MPRAQAEAGNAEGLFGGQVGVRSDQVTGRTRGAKGATPVVGRTGNRFSVNEMSAISTKGRMHFMVFTGPFDAKVVCRFLTRPAGHFDREVRPVFDRHFVHRSKTAGAWLADHRDGTEPRLLPPRTHPSRTRTSRSTPISNAVRPAPTGPGTRPNPLPGPAGSSTAANAGPASSPAASSPVRPLRPRRVPPMSFRSIEDRWIEKKDPVTGKKGGTTHCGKGKRYKAAGIPGIRNRSFGTL